MIGEFSLEDVNKEIDLYQNLKTWSEIHKNFLCQIIWLEQLLMSDNI